MLWCSRICPLGFLLGFARRLRQQALLLIKGKAPERDFVLESRRDLIKGVCLGLPLTVASEGILASELVDSGAPVLPPGAGNAVNFHAACTRCYACVAACPSKVLTVGLPDSLNVPAWFAPHLKPGKVACSETCNRCSQVCSPGAIKFTPLPEKRKLQIGLAQVDRKTCVAWSEGQVCMACDEYCPYHAIDSDTSADGVSRPVVNPDKCRGCGYCMISCPVAKPGPAISVKGVLNQRTLKG
jgi:ferredoxin